MSGKNDVAGCSSPGGEVRTPHAEVRAGQIAQLYSQVRIGMYGTVAAALALAFLLWNVVPHERVVVWLAVLLGVQVPRHVLLQRFRSIEPRGDAALPWANWFLLGSGTTALLFGLSAVVMFPSDSFFHQCALACVLGGFAASTSVAHAPLLECYVSSVLLSLLPLLGRFYYQGGQSSLVLAVVGLFFAAALLGTANSLHRMISTSIRLRFQRDETMRNLQQAHETLEACVEERTLELERRNSELVSEIRERQIIDAALRSEKSRFHTLAEHLPLGLVSISGEGDFLYVNRKFQELFGYTLTDVPDGRHWLRLAYPDPEYRGHVTSCWIADLDRSQPGEQRPREFDVTCRDGSKKTVLFLPVQLPSGEHLMTCADVTEQKRAERALEGHVSMMEAILDNAADGICAFHHGDEFPDVRFTHWNPRMTEITEYTMGQINESGWHHTLFPDPNEQARAIERMARMRAGEDLKAEEWVITTKSGTEKPLSISTSIIKEENGKIHVVANFLDMSQRKKDEADLRDSEERFRSTFEQAAVGICHVSPDGRFIRVNKKLCDVLGYSSHELLSMTFQELTHPDDLEADLDYVGQVLAGNIQTYSMEKRYIRNDGRYLWANLTVSLTREPSGRPKYFISVVEDISYRKSAEQALKDSEEKYRTLVEESFDGIFVQQGTKIVFANTQLREMMGYSESELLGLDHWLIYHPDYHELTRSRAQWRMRGEPAPPRYEVKLQRKDGTSFDAEINAKAVTVEGKPGVQVWIRDITERKRAEEALRKSEATLSTVLNSIPQSVFWKNRNGVYVGCNEVFARVVGLDDPDMIVGKTDFDLPWPTEEAEAYRAADQEVVACMGAKRHIIEPLQQADGTRIWVDTSKIPLIDQNNRVYGVLGVCDDITERKRVEEERILYAQRLEALLQLGQMRDAPLDELAAFAMEEAVRLTRSTIGYVAFANEDESVLTMHAWSREAMRQCEISDKPITYQVAETGLWGEAVRQRRPVITNDYRAPNPLKKGTPEGHVQIVRHMNVPVIDDERVVIVAGVGNKRDDYDDDDVRQLTLLMEGMWRIVRGKLAENALQESEELFRTAFHTSPDSVNINRLSDGMYVDVNDGFSEITGFSRDEVIGKALSQIDLWHDSKARNRFISVMKERGQVRNLEAQFRLKDGQIRTGLVSARIIILDGEPHILSVTRDVEDWKRAEKALAESERRYKDLFDNSTDLIYTLDLEGNFTSVNAAVTRVLGFDPEECLDLNVRQVIHPDYLLPIQDEFQERFKKILERTGPYQIAVRAKDGHLVWLEVTSRLITHEGKINGVHGTARDITARKEAEVERSRLVTAIEKAAETIVITDPTGQILYVNPAFEETTGYSREEALGKNPRILKSGKQDRNFYLDMWKTLIGGGVWRGRLINKRKDGALYEETATISPITDEHGRIVNYVAVKRDITNEIIMQRQLLHAQKMEAMGTLAGGMAHDFNNILQAIIGYSDLLLMQQRLGDPERKKVQVIQQAAQDGADLVSRILTFSRKAESKRRPVDLNEVIRKAQRFILRTIPRMIEIRLVLEENLRIIDADPAQMEQVLVNLAVNAQHAMPDGGQLLIETSNVSLSDAYLRTHLGARAGRYVLLTVSDTGEGMESAVLDRIFEPFFTTKTNGEGTGLGLSMVHGIVSQHGGYIRCYSEPGKGTSFKIYLPVSDRELDHDFDLIRALPAFGTETILLVDDDDRIREMGKQVIEMGGYKVLVAKSGEEALEIYSSHKEAIALIVLDVIMPGMGGKRCLEELLRMDPDVRVLFASGYSSNGLALGEGSSGARGFVSKPYDSGEILTAIRRVLDEGYL